MERGQRILRLNDCDKQEIGKEEVKKKKDDELIKTKYFGFWVFGCVTSQ